MYDGFEIKRLDDSHDLHVGRLPADIMEAAEAQFEHLWQMHPAEHAEVVVIGKPVPIPRWQQAYGRSYRFTGQVAAAKPVPPELSSLFDWSRAIDPKLNGLLINWYDGSLGHYIGPHRDAAADLVRGCPIVTISLGEERIFRLRPFKGPGFVDFSAASGAVFVLPYTTNHAWTHEIPRRSCDTGRRISVTLRAFLG